jgi:hypothetical protein
MAIEHVTPYEKNGIVVASVESQDEQGLSLKD